MPTQIGSKVSLDDSCKTTMGELVSGSIIRPLILNSISFMVPPPVRAVNKGLIIRIPDKWKTGNVPGTSAF